MPAPLAERFGPLRVWQLIISVAVLLLAYAIGSSVFLSACVGVLLWWIAAGPAEHALAVALPIAFRLALAIAVFHFESPVQIVDLAMRKTDAFTLFLQQDLWWARYLVAYPSILVMDHWGMRFADAFALYCAAILPMSAMVLLAVVRVWRRLDEVRAFAVGLAFAVLVAGIASQMNGRLIPALIGMGIILLAQARIISNAHVGAREGVLLCVGMILSHMTSGTGLVAFAVVVSVGVLAIWLRIDRALTLGLLWVLTALFGPLLFSDLMKNVDYYGGGVGAVVSMLDHGPGVLLRREPWAVPLALGATAVVLVGLWRVRARVLGIPRVLWPSALAIPVTSIGGLYGFSTLSMALPAVLVLFMCAVVSWTVAREAREMYPGKRLFDLIVAAIALVVFAPVILACAVVVRLTSPGPAIYAGVRAGRLERPFGQLKFRTMGVGADGGGFQTAEGDPRITRVGRWLRKTSLDELPQLVNVLRGEMSLVGPRPAAIAQLTLYTSEDRRERSKVRPGITGLAQVSGRSALSVAEAIRLDLEYVESASLRLDFEIVARTFAVITRRSGSN